MTWRLHQYDEHLRWKIGDLKNLPRDYTIKDPA